MLLTVAESCLKSLEDVYNNCKLCRDSKCDFLLRKDAKEGNDGKYSHCVLSHLNILNQFTRSNLSKIECKGVNTRLNTLVFKCIVAVLF